MAKTEQLQLRLSSTQKENIKNLAALAGDDVSTWVLRKLLPPEADLFQRLINNLAAAEPPLSNRLADIHDFLHSLSNQGLVAGVHSADLKRLDAFESNYLAAMVETACTSKHVPYPDWSRAIKPLTSPWFASQLKNLRLHLLTSSPPPFRRRNLFVDSTLGARV